MRSVGGAVERDVVDPHVEVRPVNADQKSHAAKGRKATGSREDQAGTDADFHHPGDEHPNRRVAQDGGDDRLEPSRVGEVLDADVDVHQPKTNRRQCGQNG